VRQAGRIAPRTQVFNNEVMHGGKALSEPVCAVLHDTTVHSEAEGLAILQLRLKIGERPVAVA